MLYNIMNPDMLVDPNSYGPYMPNQVLGKPAQPQAQQADMQNFMPNMQQNSWMNSPLLALGMGLLSQSGPSLTPVGVGPGLAKGFDLMQQMNGQNMANQFKMADLGMRQQEFQDNRADKKLSRAEREEDRALDRDLRNRGYDFEQRKMVLAEQKSQREQDNADKMNAYLKTALGDNPDGSTDTTNQGSAIPTVNTSPSQQPSMSMSAPNVVGPYNPFPTSSIGANNPINPAVNTPPPSSNTGKGIFAGLDPRTKLQAAILFSAGKYNEAFDLINKAAPAPTADGFTKNQMMGPARGGQGGTYVNPQTGEIISSNTSAQTTTDQNAIAAVQRVKPQVEDLVQKLPQFQRAGTQASAWTQGVGNKYFGTNYDLPSQQAEGNALINTTAEGLMKAFNLPSTNESLDMVKQAIAPVDGESPQGYKARVNRELQKIVMFQGQAKDRLAHGIVLNQGNQAAQQGGYSQSQLQAYAQDAIAKGADPQAVQQRLAQMQGGG